MKLTAEEYFNKIRLTPPYTDSVVIEFAEQYAQEKDKRIQELEKECEGWEARVNTYDKHIKELEEACDTYRNAYIARRDLTEKEQQIVDNV